MHDGPHSSCHWKGKLETHTAFKVDSLAKKECYARRTSYLLSLKRETGNTYSGQGWFSCNQIQLCTMNLIALVIERENMKHIQRSRLELKRPLQTNAVFLCSEWHLGYRTGCNLRCFTIHQIVGLFEPYDFIRVPKFLKSSLRPL